MDARGRSDSGQSTVEWIGIMFCVALLLGAALVVVGDRLPGGALARTIAGAVVCAVRLTGSCGSGSEPELAAAYGDEVAALVAEHAPRIRYERGMRALPVDYRSCREDACSRGAPSGEVWRSGTGEPVVAFVHVVDCRALALLRTEREGGNCSGARADNLYLQYWFYYAGSATAEGRVIPEAIRDISAALGTPTHHKDDWESYQVRIRPGAADARASAHHSYVYDLDGGWRPRVGSRPDGSPKVQPPWPKQGWGPETRTIYVSGGSHAGNARALRGVARITPRERLRLIPFEPIVAGGRRDRFAVTPPWLKDVWFDPEAEGTD